ncbi:uncharacterized protein LOC118646196 isoform X2 [Monomorium pharaonis]|nr:uncharacterized protein LOC118646196 isoform X2 [Monomorium pharaonis]
MFTGKIFYNKLFFSLLLLVRNKFMTEIKDEKIKFQDSDETEIDSDDLIEYILQKQSDSFILNIVTETSAASGSMVQYSTTAIDSLFASTSSACDNIILPIEQYLENTKENVSASTFAYDDVNISVLPIEQYLKPATENVSARTSSACNNICTSPDEQNLKTAKENTFLLRSKK